MSGSVTPVLHPRRSACRRHSLVASLSGRAPPPAAAAGAREQAERAPPEHRDPQAPPTSPLVSGARVWLQIRSPDCPTKRGLAQLMEGTPRSWSEVPLELAGLVLGRLPSHIDRVRFGAVCSQWRSAVQQAPV